MLLTGGHLYWLMSSSQRCSEFALLTNNLRPRPLIEEEHASTCQELEFLNTELFVDIRLTQHTVRR